MEEPLAEERRIRVLPDGVVNQIAAGEVVERPASVLKELIDNALDAGATRIDVTIDAAGQERISVADDGRGMSRHDALAALERHATSKIERLEDLERIASLGFRGEALPSIAAVSRMLLETAPAGGEGTALRVEGGRVAAVERAARATGTTVDVRQLFYNTPARKRFLKSHATEQAHLVQRLVEHALARVDVAWRATHGPRAILSLAPARDLRERLAGLYDTAYVDTLLPVEELVEAGLAVDGMAQRPVAAATSRRRLFVFVNGRPVDAPDVLKAALRGYRSTLPAGTRPDLFLRIRIDPSAVDVNVHPAKREVRFRDPAGVAAAVEEAIRSALGAGPAVASRVPLERSSRRSSSRASAAALRVAEPRGRGSVNGAPVAGPDQLALFVSRRARTAAQEPIESAVADLDRAAVEAGLWQLHDRFILAQTGRGLAIIDQHSAHERILYEEVVADLREGERPAQRLLFPLVLHLTPIQRATWESYQGLIGRLGFEIEPFGGDAIAVSAVPAFRHAFDPEGALAGLLDDLSEPGGGSADMNQHERVARLFACKAAIKAGSPLAREEMAELIDRLFATRLPYDDVHGRPAVLQIGLEDLDRHFGRH
ncbi:MAG TPA: DNA mismatch repair endonuclease MutL [Gemmatimonadota bacterium]|nr:DNA mismatch repair endonuclease MutL [Gemmatimonadota bacterium]